MIDLMLETDFLGRDTLRTQVRSAVVVAEYPRDPTVLLEPAADTPRLCLADGGPVWGAAPLSLITRYEVLGEEIIGEVICALLHIREGRAAELEIYRANGDEFVPKADPPPPGRFQVQEDPAEALAQWSASLGGSLGQHGSVD